MKRLKYLQASGFFLLFLAIAVVLPIFTPYFAQADTGDYNENWGDRDTARKKEWFSVLENCANDSLLVGSTITDLSDGSAGTSWNTQRGLLTLGELFSSNISTSKLNSGDWFDTSYVSKYHSPYVENQIFQKYDDGTFTCGDKNNALVKQGVPELGVTYKDIICNYSDEYKSPGVLSPPDSSTTNCGGLYDTNSGEDVFSVKTTDMDYFAKVVKEKHNQNVDEKKGKINGSMLELTDLEEYFIKHDAFVIACTSGDPVSDGGAYSIQEINGNTTQTISYNKAANSNEKTNVIWFLTNKSSCQGLADDLSGKSERGKELIDALKKYAEYLKENNMYLEQDRYKSKADCLTSGGAGNLGYIICNILDMLGEATTQIYDGAVKPALEVEPKLFSSEGSTYDAWSTFQGLANILFVIFFLFVIFSQVTGVGIDNYGIKKIMPKLIVAAILINLSFVICQLCVDLSNILGNSIQSLFENLPAGPPDDSLQGVASGINAGTEVSVALLSSLAIGGAALMIWTSPAIVISLLVGAIGVAISIFFIFILLSAREAAIVVLTVISPMAFACYILPNTKSLFDKFVKFGEGLLLVYPICGLLMGGGNFVARLLLSSGIATQGFWSALIAMLAGIIPIFFLPTVLKGSFAALGNLGARISGFGDRMRSGATGKIRGSDGYKNLQRVSQQRKVRIKAGRDKDGNLTNAGRVKSWIAQHGIGKTIYGRTFAGYSNAAEKNRQEDIEAASTIDSAVARAYLAKNPEKAPKDYYSEQLKNAVKNKKSANEIFSTIDAAKKAGIKDKDIAEMTRQNLDGDSLQYMGDGGKSNFLREFGGRYGGDFLKKDSQQKLWSLSGGMQDGKKTNVSGYKVKPGDLTDNDIASLSKNNFERLAQDGAISNEQASRVHAANGGEDDAMRLMLGEWGKYNTLISADEADKRVANPNKDARTKQLLEKTPVKVQIDSNKPNPPAEGGTITPGGIWVPHA